MRAASQGVSVFTLRDIVQRLGDPAAFQRVLQMHAVVTRRSDRAVAARVRDVGPPREVLVSHDLRGRCACDAGTRDGFCDHVAAAALEWLLEPGEPVATPASANRFG